MCKREVQPGLYAGGTKVVRYHLGVDDPGHGSVEVHGKRHAPGVAHLVLALSAPGGWTGKGGWKSSGVVRSQGLVFSVVVHRRGNGKLVVARDRGLTESSVGSVRLAAGRTLRLLRTMFSASGWLCFPTSPASAYFLQKALKT